ASYKVLPMWKQPPTEGYETLVDPQNNVTSPFGWYNDAITITTVTAGNNVIIYIGVETSTTSQSSSPLTFDYTYDSSDQQNPDAARTNAFLFSLDDCASQNNAARVEGLPDACKQQKLRAWVKGEGWSDVVDNWFAQSGNAAIPIGEVWDIYAALVADHGWSSTARVDATG
ncbi:hypothetical protein MPER_08266, partial [Moniliophthora perniciosa FA553]